MFGKISEKLEVKASIKETWEVYGTLKIAMIIRSELAQLFDVKILEGDGGVGTLIQVTPHAGVTDVRAYTERIAKINEEKKVKELEMIEGGYLEVGFSSYRIIFELIEKENDHESCIVRVTVEYETNEDAANAARVSVVTIKPLIYVLEVVNQCIHKQKQNPASM